MDGGLQGVAGAVQGKPYAMLCKDLLLHSCKYSGSKPLEPRFQVQCVYRHANVIPLGSAPDSENYSSP